MRPSMQRLRRALAEIAPRIYTESRLLRDLSMLDIGSGIEPHELPIPSTKSGWIAVHPGSRWGGHDRNAWFHASAHVPETWHGQLEGGERKVALRLLLGLGTEFGWPEGLLYVNGRLQQGINRHHPDVLLRPDDVEAKLLTFDVRAWSGMLPDDHRIETAEIALLDRPTEHLYHLLTTGTDLVDALGESDPLLYDLAGALETAYDTVELSHATFYESVRVAVGQLEVALHELSDRYQPVSRPVVTAVGHGHLDVAWLWQTRHTREKTARTFATATALMDLCPEYVFLHTTPQVYAWLKDDYPALYERVVERVNEGRFEAAGAMWVESDCNLVSGEALVRQILYGQRFLREEFGREYTALWLPDAFGYSASLPQIMLRAGLPLFMTTKMSWSEINRIPADTFHWRGIDGSVVLAHFITTPTLGGPSLFANMDTYNGSLNVKTVRGVWERYRQKAMNGETLLAYGYGDGGAGPTRQQLEHAHAMQLLPGMPELRLGRADAYFERLRANLDSRQDLPYWDGELYLEYHRGTYTTQSWLKRMHRQLEGALLLVEWLDAWQWSIHADKTPDRLEVLDAAWRTILLHEFHDILPGSSIATVYWDARVALSELAGQLTALTSEILAGIVGELPHDGVLVLNPSPFARHELLSLPEPAGGGFPQIDGQWIAMQHVEEDGVPTVLVDLPEMPGRGFRIISWTSGAMPTDRESLDSHSELDVEASEDRNGITLRNAFFTIQLNTHGEIVSLRDHRVASGREIIPSGDRANVLVAYEDLPRDFDAWDIDSYYTRKPYHLETTEVRIVESGPLRAAVCIERRFRSSSVTQRIIMYRAHPRIDFETHIDWHEQHILLKAAFPLDLHATHATAEIQYGAIERPLHRNSSWDQARFEIPAHRWVDLSEGNYGVSLLNDGRYGHDIGDGSIRLTLLRSPTFPDPQADQGEHTVTYSLYPHLGDWRAGGTVAAGYGLNRPFVTQTLPEVESRHAAGATQHEEVVAPSDIMLTTDAEDVVIEAIKRSVDGQHIIVRMYEAYGNRVQAQIRSALALREVVECDLQERPLTPEGSPAYALWYKSSVASHDAPEVSNEGWACEFRPFEIRTFRVKIGVS